MIFMVNSLSFEFLLRLSPELIGRPDLLRAVALVNKSEEWKNPQIKGIVDSLNQPQVSQFESCDDGFI
jgi:hypothetical protein